MSADAGGQTHTAYRTGVGFGGKTCSALKVCSCVTQSIRGTTSGTIESDGPGLYRLKQVNASAQNGKYVAQVQYEYDYRGNRTSQTYFRVRQQTNLLETETRKQGKVTQTWQYRYDQNGNELFRIWEKTSPTPDYPGKAAIAGKRPRKAPTIYEWCHYNGFNQLTRINQDTQEITYQY